MLEFVQEWGTVAAAWAAVSVVVAVIAGSAIRFGSGE